MAEGSEVPALEGLKMPQISFSTSLEALKFPEDLLVFEEPHLSPLNMPALEKQPVVSEESRLVASTAPGLKDGAHALTESLSTASLALCDKESQRLSTVSSSSSNERMSSSASLSTDVSDSERPVSLVSTASSNSPRDSHCISESNGVEASMSQPPNGFKNRRLDLHLDLLPSTEETLQMDYRDPETARSPKISQMHNNVGSLRTVRGSKSLSPFASKVAVVTHKLSYVERVVLELVETERMYVRDLRSIVEEYLGKIIDAAQELPMGPEQVSALFGNIEDIYELNSELLQDLDSCHNDPVAVANCFVEKSQDFDVYTQYCTNYPNSVAALTECMRNKALATFFRERQEQLNHSLPLGSYLLKPVQRILKYHLLLQEIAKHFDVEKEGYERVEDAIDTMTGVAWYINDMKRKHEHAIRLQEIQSLLLNWKGNDLTTYGELLLEGTFRIQQRARNERTLFLFDKALFITKKRGDHFTYKTHILCSSLMLIESSKDSLCFSVTHYKNSKQQHNIQARTVEEKRLWTHHIKKLILENHHAIIPQKAKEAILEMDALYPSRYKYSPERTKKAMPMDEQTVLVPQGRRQSEPSRNILKQLSENVNLKHSGSDGALLDPGDLLQPSTGTLDSSFGQPETERKDAKKEESLEHLNLSDSRRQGTGAEQTASEEDEDEAETAAAILMGEDQSTEIGEQEVPKGFKRQNSQSSGNAEKRRSVEMLSAPEPADADTPRILVQEDQLSEEIHSDVESVDLPKPVLEAKNRDPENGLYVDVHDQLDHAEFENAEDLKPLSSEDEDEEAAVHEAETILPPSVLDQASIIAERFINSLSRRSSLALDDGKLVGCLTPRLTSRCASVPSLECIEKSQYHNNSCELQACQPAEEVTLDPVNETACISPIGEEASPGPENMVEEDDKFIFKRRESILSTRDRLLIDKIRSYYDHAEHHDATFSIKRRESLSYIPAGVVRNSVFKFNSLPKYDWNGDFSGRKRTDSTSSITGASKATSRASSDGHAASKPSSINQHRSAYGSTSAAVEDGISVEDAEFKSPSKLIEVWEEMERAGSETWTKDCQVLTSADKECPEPTLVHRENDNHASRNSPMNETSDGGVDVHEPLLILEDSDLSTIMEESLASSPQSTSPSLAVCGKLICDPSNLDHNLSGLKEDLPLKLPPKIIQLANGLGGDMTEKMKNRVYQMARQYSQRIKSNKPVVQRRLKELEEDLRRISLPSLQEEKQELTGKSKLNLTPSLPSYDRVTVQEHSPLIPPSSCSPREKSPKRFSFSPSSHSPGISPNRLDCKSPHSPVKTEKFHWPDVRELRSKYASRASVSQEKLLPVSRSQSVPEKIAEKHLEESLEGQTKAKIGHSCSMNVRQADSLADLSTKQGRQYCRSKIQEEIEVSEGTLVNSSLNGGILESLQNHRNESCGTGESYYISAEAPLENNKRVVVMEKLPALEDELDGPDKDVHDSYVQMRSFTSQAIIDRCKSYQESEEYYQQEEELKDTFPDSEGVPQQMLWEMTAQKRQGHVKNLREKFQTLSSSS